MRQPDDPGQVIEKHYHGNGTTKLVWGAASLFGITLLTICGVALAKVYDLGERMARVETTLEILVKQK